MAWIVVVWISMKVVKGLMKLLHPPELMVWISCGLDEHESPQAFELLPRMGASPQTPWLRGAGAPLRIPPGGACGQPCAIRLKI